VFAERKANAVARNLATNVVQGREVRGGGVAQDVVDGVGLVGGVDYGSGRDAQLERHVGR